MKKYLKITITAIIAILLTVALYLIGFKAEWIRPIIEGAGVWGYFVYLILQIIITTLLCFVPATTFTFTLLAVQLFGVTGGLFISILGCWLSSMIMFLTGRYGGVKLVDWLIGKEGREKAQSMISARAVVLVPVMLVCPFFPDDAICMVSGITKMKFLYFSICALISRSLGITVTALLGNDFTINYIKSALGSNIVLWILAINVILFDIYVIWKFSGWIEKLINKHKAKKQEKLEDSTEVESN